MLIIRDMPVLFYVSTSSRTHIFIVVIRTNCISLPNRLSLEYFKLTKHQSFQQHEILGIFLFEDGLLRKMKAFNDLCFKREQFLLTFILLIFY